MDKNNNISNLLEKIKDNEYILSVIKHVLEHFSTNGFNINSKEEDNSILPSSSIIDLECCKDYTNGILLEKKSIIILKSLGFEIINEVNKHFLKKTTKVELNVINDVIKQIEKLLWNSFCSEIIKDKLYLGSKQSSEDLNKLKEFGIKTVIICDPCLKERFPNEIEYTRFKVNDLVNSKIQDYFGKAYDIIENNVEKGGVLVHCFAGVSRSSTIVVSYLMKKNGWTFKKALKFVKEKRDCANPNYGFRIKLYKYQRSLKI